MELCTLPLILLLISNIHHGHSQVFPGIPKPFLTVQPESSQIFRGVTVTLTCHIQGEGWIHWRCENYFDNIIGNSLTFTMQYTQTCWCYCTAAYPMQAFCSHWSDAVTLTVLDNPSVIVKPQTSVFTGDTVTLSCDVGRSPGQTIIWYKDSTTIKTGDETETLGHVRVSDGGMYRCAVQRQNYNPSYSQSVMLTVSERPKPVVRVDPDRRVFRGQTVTLTCHIQQTDVSSWIYRWKKDDSLIHQSQEYWISSVNESHTGRYSCTGRETQGSRYSHTSDDVTLTVSGPLPGLSVLKLLSFLLAASLYLLVSIILGVKYYRAHVQSDEIKYTVTEE